MKNSFIKNIASLVFAVSICCQYSELRAAEYRMLALQQEGQASLSIDDLSKTAFIVDLGKNGDGDKIMLGAKNLFDYLAEDRGIKNLVIACSHPHSDHMGGIKALFKNASSHLFYNKDLSRPKFQSITVIDDGTNQSLAKLYQKFSKSISSETNIVFSHETDLDKKDKPRNAFEATSKLQREVFIQNIPYDQEAKSHLHDRSIITLTQIRKGDKTQTIVDFDDASTAAIKSSTNKLKAMGISEIDLFIVPHHGSKFSDIEPILNLKPKRAIISVNPNNRYGHPTAPILEKLITKLSAENVLFTGSIGDIVLDENGVKQALHTAAQHESYALFVAEARSFVEKNKQSVKRDQELALFKRIEGLMNGSPPDDYFPSTQAPTTPHSPNSPSGMQSSFQRKIDYQGSILSENFEVGYIPLEGIEQSTLAEKKIFSATNFSNVTDHRAVVYVNSWNQQQSFTQHYGNKLQNISYQLRYDSPIGIESAVFPAHEVILPAKEIPKIVTPQIAKMPPAGGMVWLNGGKVMIEGNQTNLVGAVVVECKNKICLRTPNGDLELPIANSPLFHEVWQKIAVEGVESFYLSINPKKQFLQLDSHENTIPYDKLYFDSSKTGNKKALNDVVTSGGIEHSQIGQILWNADVAFKSGALGFNVLTGEKSQRLEASMDTLPDSSDRLMEDLNENVNSRWCRLYWQSGAPKFNFDTFSKKINVTGNVVLAKAEAMLLRSGELHNHPQGKWCEREKSLAASLQKLANSKSASIELKQLYDLALMQSFASWAKNNHIAAPEVSFNKQSNNSAYSIPKWTSGIRTAPTTLVQEEIANTSQGRAHYIHIALSDNSVLESCVYSLCIKRYKERPSLGVSKDKTIDVCIVDNTTMPKPNDWVTHYAKNVASCSNGKLYPAVQTNKTNDGNDDEFSGSIGLKMHSLSSQIHGGVLLGLNNATRPFEYAYEKKAMIWTPDGRLVFKLIGNELHFWNSTANNQTTINLMQHLAFTDANVKDIYPKEGFLRFVISTNSGSFVRKEMRAQGSFISVKGFEWIEALHASDGTSVFQKAVWPCSANVDGLANCINVSEPNINTLKEGINKLGANLALDARYIDTDTWLVEIDLSRLKNVIHEQQNKTDANGFSIASKLAQWGFNKDAANVLDVTLQSLSPDAQDTILQHSLNQSNIELGFIGQVYFIRDLDNLVVDTRSKKLTINKMLSRMTKIEKSLEVFSPSSVTPIFEEMSAICEKMANENNKLSSNLRDAGKKYQRKAQINRYLATGILGAALTSNSINEMITP